MDSIMAQGAADRQAALQGGLADSRLFHDPASEIRQHEVGPQWKQAFRVGQPFAVSHERGEQALDT
jgi:hypothetical protein